MFCILGPEMALGDPQAAGRTLRSRFSSNRLRKDQMQTIPQKPGQPEHRTLGSIFSSNYDSVRSSVKRAASVRVTKRERNMTRAQDIFPSNTKSTSQWSHTPEPKSVRSEAPLANGAPSRSRSATPLSVSSLHKPLPPLPDESSEAHSDVLVQDFEGYLDMLTYLQRGLPSRPTTEQKPRSERKSTATSMQTITNQAPKEAEWMSARPDSQTSSHHTASASSDELRRLRSRPPSGAATRSTSVSGKTVTPKSSTESEWGVRGGKVSLSGLGFAARIEEVSEPGTASPILTPNRRSTSMLQVCYHCGRDPTGKDMKDTGGSPTTVLEIPKVNSPPGGTPRKDLGPRITARDAQGQRYALYKETSHFTLLEEDDEVSDEMPKTPEKGQFWDFSSPLARPSNPDPYDTTYSSAEDLPKQRQQAEIEIEDNIEVCNDSETAPSFVSTIDSSVLKLDANHDPYAPSKSPSYRLRQSETTEEPKFGTEMTPDTTFWKNPEGVILVYQGVEVAGKEQFYGSDINYLGSFYDDDEGSSGLGSTRESSHDLVGSGYGLAMIPEGGSSDDLWGDETLNTR